MTIHSGWDLLKFFDEKSRLAGVEKRMRAVPPDMLRAAKPLLQNIVDDHARSRGR